MSTKKSLIFKANDNRLAFKKEGEHVHSLCYKATPMKHIMVSFGWGNDSEDLDICAYWNSAEGLKVGYNYNYTADPPVAKTYNSGDYYITYSGDIRGVDKSEWVDIWVNNISKTESFTIHLNFWGTPGSGVCNIVASQSGGQTIVINNFSCGTKYNQPAQPGKQGSPYVTITVDSDGNMISMNMN